MIDPYVCRLLLSFWPDLQSISWAGDKSPLWRDLAMLFDQLLLAQSELTGVQLTGAPGHLIKKLFSEMKKTCERIWAVLDDSDPDSGVDSDAGIEDESNGDWEE